MTYNVCVYHKSIPDLTNNEKIELLKNFSLGILAAGDSVTDIYDSAYRGTEDVSVIQGWISDESSRKKHQQLRRSIINNQLQLGKYVVAADSSLFLYADSSNRFHYLRYSFNGVFPTTGIYCDKEIDPTRWKKISKDLNISLEDYRTDGVHILLCLQRNGGWSMGGLEVLTWLNNVITDIRLYSDRPIVVRPHPGDREAINYLRIFKDSHSFKDVTLSDSNNTLQDDLKNCWAAVNHNSSPAVGAAIKGIPIFVTDRARSQCKEISDSDFSKIENPIFYDRLGWVQRLSMFHWKFDELISGECWSHMRNYIVKEDQ